MHHNLLYLCGRFHMDPMVPKILGFEEFRSLTLDQLTGSRTLMRDLHDTLMDPRRNPAISKYLTPFGIYDKKGRRWKSASFYEGFAIGEDQSNLYFFDQGWPVKFMHFLRPEDLVPTERFTLDMSEESLEEALRLLREKNVALEMISVPLCNFERLIGNPDLLKEKAAVTKVSVPITTMNDLRFAIYAGHPDVLKAIRRKPVPFTKCLKRAREETVEFFNHRSGKWELEKGFPRLPGLLKRLIMRLSRK